MGERRYRIGDAATELVKVASRMPTFSTFYGSSFETFSDARKARSNFSNSSSPSQRAARSAIVFACNSGSGFILLSSDILQLRGSYCTDQHCSCIGKSLGALLPLGTARDASNRETLSYPACISHSI
jgi:hypothetical protein